MQLDISLHAVAAERRRGLEQPFGLQAERPHLRAERPARPEVDRGLQLRRFHEAECRAGSEVPAVVAGEPATALLRPHGHDSDILRRHDAALFYRRDRGQPGDHAGGAVVVAALRHGVEMRPGDHARRPPVAPGERVVGVARRVARYLEAEAARGGGEHVVGELLALAVGGARDAAAVGGPLRQIGEEPLRQRHAGADPFGQPPGFRVVQSRHLRSVPYFRDPAPRRGRKDAAAPV